MTESPAQRAGEARIGVIGWGRMGGPMGRRWLEAGHSVVAFDLSESSIADAERSGAQVAESP
ncbi:MAG TPA: NAD(P)-binding domain-containing protein, partial [Acidimicrobiia bacterium]|nr:NAD(P)-binding domain-containing protein [Acidimicrobiia bacterium]